MTIEELAHKLTDEQWEVVLGDASDCTDGVFCIDTREHLALLAYVRELAASLVEPECDVLAGRGDWGPTASFACAGHLRGKGLHEWVPEGDGKCSSATPLGRAVLRVLA